MATKQLITIAIAAVVLFGGATAVGAASPADAANETAGDVVDGLDHQGVTPPAPTSASELQDENAEDVGPSDGVPEEAAAHVSDVLDRIDAFMEGSIDNLGDSLSDLLSNDDDTEEDGEANAQGGAPTGA